MARRWQEWPVPSRCDESPPVRMTLGAGPSLGSSPLMARIRNSTMPTVAEHRAALDRLGRGRGRSRAAARRSGRAAAARCRDANASISSPTPGAIAPPRKPPPASTTSNVVAVPRSTTIAGAPYRRHAAKALTSRSLPAPPSAPRRLAIGTVSSVASSSSQSAARGQLTQRFSGGRHDAGDDDLERLVRGAGTPERLVDGHLQLERAVRGRRGRAAGRGDPAASTKP